MKRSQPRNVSAALATATCALLGSGAAQPVHAEDVDGWSFDSALLYYGESDGRVQDGSLNVLATRRLTDDRAMTFGLTVDGLTGATPNGAVRQPVPQTFTRPSGAAGYTTAPGELPLDDTFHDTRVAVTAGWSQPLGRLNTVSLGTSLSSEYDYKHIGVDVKFARDFNQRNTTLSTGFAFSHDEIDAVGGIPDPMTEMLGSTGRGDRDDEEDEEDGDDGEHGGRSETKEVLDFVVGLTQVLSRTTLLQVNYSYSDSSGYQTDPYKLLSLVDPVSGLPVPRPPLPDETLYPSGYYYYESRPDSRAKHSVYAELRHYLGGKVLGVSYRYMTDDWDIVSHTVDARLRWPIGASHYLEPHLRFYTQSEANFYMPLLVSGEPLPRYASADYRLGQFDAMTAGLKFGWETGNGNDMSVRLELYQQRGDVPQADLPGTLTSADVYPDLDAVIAQFSYSF